MSCQIKVTELDLSFFIGDPTWLVLTVEEAVHGYNYTLTCYRADDAHPLGSAKHWTFYDQPSADAVVCFMVTKIKEIIG